MTIPTARGAFGSLLLLSQPAAVPSRSQGTLCVSHGRNRAAASVSGRPETSSLTGLIPALFANGCFALWVAARKGRVGRQRVTSRMVSRRPIVRHRDKMVSATKRIPLWRLDDEMYLHRQLAPDPNSSWTAIKRAQAKMREAVQAQMKKDMKAIERELSGFRLKPTYPIGEIKAGMWLEGRVSAMRNYGVKVDVGAYLPTGEWIDGYLHVDQILEDGRYIDRAYIADHIHLGERINVRVRQCTPATGELILSKKKDEDLPELFLGKPRPYSIFDLEPGMPVTGIVRRSLDQAAFVDIGADRLGIIRTFNQWRGVDEDGFESETIRHRHAYTAFPLGAQLDLWVLRVETKTMHIRLTAQKPTWLRDKSVQNEAGSGMPEGMFNPEEGFRRREDPELKMKREMQEKETAEYDPWVPHVDEWLEDAMEPDEEQDSWVARTERELFEEVEAESKKKKGIPLKDIAAQIDEIARDAYEDKEFPDQDDFADDEFADDDFAGDDFVADRFSAPSFPEKQLDGWVIDESKPEELEKQTDNDKSGLTEAEIEAIFDSEDDEEGSGSRKGWGGSRPPPR